MTEHANDLQIAIGTHVIDKSGQQVGTLAYVVVQPPRLHVTDYVVNTGSWLGRDIVIPVEHIGQVDGNAITLTIDKTELESLPDYIEVHYTAPPESWTPGGGLFYPATGVLWPADVAYPEDASVKVNAPAGTVGIAEGMKVESSDGHRVGSVKAVETDTGTGDLSEVVVHEGLIFGHDERFPADLIGVVHPDRLTLTLTKAEIEARHSEHQVG